MGDKTQPPPRQRRPPRAETRQRILDAALEVFLEKGFATTSVEDVVARAGLSRGGFYSNFEDKDELFLALMDSQINPRVREITAIVKDSSAPDVFDNLRRWHEHAPQPVGWTALFAEFRAHALRNESARQQLVERERALRGFYERAIEGQFRAAGLEPPAPVWQLALIVHMLDAMTTDLHALDPETVPETFFFDAVDLLFRAGVALAAGGRAP